MSTDEVCRRGADDRAGPAAHREVDERASIVCVKGSGGRGYPIPELRKIPYVRHPRIAAPGNSKSRE